MTRQSGYYHAWRRNIKVKAFYSSEHDLWKVPLFGWVTGDFFDEIEETRILAPDEVSDD